MLATKAKSLLRAPLFEDEEKSRIGRTLYIILLSAIGAAFIIAAYNYSYGQHRPFLIAGINVVIIAFLLWLTRRGHLHAAGFTTLLLFMGTIIFSMISGDGSHDLMIVIFPAVTIVASLLLNRQAFIVFSTISILSIGVVAWGEISGLIVNRMSGFTTHPEIIVSAAILFCVTVAIRLLTENLIQTIAKARRNETALRESKARFQELAELLPETIFEIDLDGRLTFVNHNAFDQFGYTEQDLAKGLNAMDMLVPEDRERAFNAIAEKLKGDETVPVEFTAFRKDGTRFPIMIRPSRIIHNRQPVGLRGFIIDISERKRAEASLKESEARFRTIFEQAAVGIAFTDTRGNLLQVNQRFCDLLGYTYRELVGINAAHITHSDDIETEIEEIGKLEKGHKKIHIAEKRYVRKDGTAIWTKITASLVRGTSGRPNYFIAIIEDITARKEAEDELIESETRYRMILNTVPDTITISRLADGTRLQVNDAFCQITGFSREEVLGRPPRGAAGR